MCGINGIAYSGKSGKMVSDATLTAMRDVQIHRGPDSGDSFIDRNIGLGHRRLSIVDVANGHQPMQNANGNLTIAYNGEIYNHSDFRKELEEKGYNFKTTSDTEVILYLFEEYGVESLERLRGMFAFAIWDKEKRELFVARDRVGIKPLYYVHDSDGSIFFASEMKSLFAGNAIKPELNYDSLPDQLANHGTSYDETLYKNVKRLLPGHFAKWKDGEISIRKYWDIDFEPKIDDRSEKELVEEWYTEFKKSVELRLMADVPLGMFLSGGIDSSAICAVMADMVDDPIKTFSVGFKEREANEFEYARIVSDRFSTDHHEITITPDQYFGELPRMIWNEDEPLGFTASIPLFFVSKLAQKHVKVVLTGEGSDELMAGYSRYNKALRLLDMGEKYATYTPSLFRKGVRAGIDALPRSLNYKLQRTFLTREINVQSLLFDNFAIFNQHMQSELLTDDAQARIRNLNPFERMTDFFESANANETLDRILYTDMRTYMAELLMKQDQMSMAASIESRVPFLDHKLIEFTSRLPVNMKLRGNETKWILREAMKDLLPREILSREKMGFPVPIGQWLRYQYRYLVDEYILSERALSRGIFNPDFVRYLVAQHDAGANHDLRLYFLLNFEIWYRQNIEGETVNLINS